MNHVAAHSGSWDVSPLRGEPPHILGEMREQLHESNSIPGTWLSILLLFSRRGKNAGPRLVWRRRGEGEAKFWLEPEIELAKNYHYARKQLKEIETLIEAHYDELISAWQQHFNS